MRDYAAVVWTRAGGMPTPMGNLFVTGNEARFSYEEAFLDSGLPGLGILYPPEIFGPRPVVFQRRGRFALHPPLNALIPPHDPHNFQRRLALAYLRERGLQPEAGFDEDWSVMMVTGHGAIGHLDLFADDDSARAWYQAPHDDELHETAGRFGFSLTEYLSWQDGDAADLLPLLGPTPCAGGMIPKLLTAIPDSDWDDRIGLPTRSRTAGLTDVVLKLEQTASYPGLLELEALALELHRRAGFEVPCSWLARVGDIPVLAVERFDRDPRGWPCPLESLYSVMAAGSAEVTDNHSISYDRIADAIANPHIPILSDKKAGRRHLLRRLLLALLSGNGDMHLENLSILNRAGVLSFSPVYDPTPMRAYSRHDLLAPMGFGGYGEGAALRQALLNFTHSLELRRSDLEANIRDLLPLMPGFRAEVEQLETLPAANKSHLIAVSEWVEGRVSAG
jgi:serine/threonine-protein kinase HipA